MKADVTEGSAKLAEAISDDSDAVICATGFRPSWDLFAPWKVGESYFGSYGTVFHYSIECIIFNDCV